MFELHAISKTGGLIKKANWGTALSTTPGVGKWGHSTMLAKEQGGVEIGGTPGFRRGL